PLIAPLYATISCHEMVGALIERPVRSAYEIVRQTWRARNHGSDFESTWRKALSDGVFTDKTLPSLYPSSGEEEENAGLPASALKNTTKDSSTNNLEILFRPDPNVLDGRYANNGWLQELPKPLSKLTWDNAALVSPNTAKQLGLEKTFGKKGGDIYVDTIKITHQGRTIKAPVPTWITPGQPDGVITIHLGYGRQHAGRVGNEHGFSAYDIRTSDSPWSASGIQVEKANVQAMVAVTQLHFMLEDRDFSKEDRDVLRSQTLEEYLKGTPAGESHDPAPDDTLYKPYDYKNQENGLNYAWGMAIDLNNCVGCNACTIACQSENNIPVVGKEQVVRSREMHWIRVDTYFKGEDANHPEATNFMPVPCMHCENAPCEPVCPVHATVHSAEGLNDMVYNRCVGTKYCSNNCPYKVRRFNFFLYQDWEAPQYQLMRNPDVSVRSRGVMEKCTYCVQRIQSAKIQSELEGRKVRDGEIVTACQAVCPTEAIVFGDVNDPNSRVSRIKAEHRNYSLLGELNTKPRTTYLTALRNPNPELSENG
ncbi:MAG TPA: 4Fe-4S dicluster domain-containing protein, partial [Pyrinomonadaceae bacterium]